MRTAWFPSPAEGSPSIAPTRPRGSNAFHRDGGERDPGGGRITHGRLRWAVSGDSDASPFVPLLGRMSALFGSGWPAPPPSFPFGGGEPAPHPVAFVDGERVGRALVEHRAGGADPLGHQLPQ